MAKEVSTLKNMIFALVGPSGSGKSTLIKEALEIIGNKIGIVRSLTTRAQKDELDALFYDFVTQQEFNKKLFADELVEWVEYAGNSYGYERTTVDAVLKEKLGICAATEHGVIALMQAGYHVKAIGITTIYQKSPINAEREKEDRERAKLHITFQKEITNSFLKGGKEKAVKELVDYIKNFTKGGK